MSRSEELEREEVVGGHRVELADGQAWLVPTVRCFPSGTRFPLAFGLNEAGQEVMAVLPVYRHLQEEAERFWQWRYATGLAAAGEKVEVVALSDEELRALAGEALAVNYRVEPSDLEALLTPENLVLVLDALVDGPTMRTLLPSQGEDRG